MGSEGGVVSPVAVGLAKGSHSLGSEGGAECPVLVGLAAGVRALGTEGGAAASVLVDLPQRSQSLASEVGEMSPWQWAWWRGPVPCAQRVRRRLLCWLTRRRGDDPWARRAR